MTPGKRPEAEAVTQALLDLRKRITVSLRAFNDATPHASWLKRSEIARITRDILRTAERASRRRPAPVRLIGALGSRLRRVVATVRGARYDDRLAPASGTSPLARAEALSGGAEQASETPPVQGVERRKG